MGAFQSIKISRHTDYKNNQDNKDNKIINYHFLEQRSAQQFEDFIKSCEDDGLFDINIDIEDLENNYFTQDYNYTQDCRIFRYSKPKNISRTQCYCKG